jgi:O-antigen/teichoic acid export membrane protein
MLKSLFRDSILYTLSTVLTRGISFILLPVYTQALSTEEFGLLDYFVALGAIASVVITLEIVQGLARYIPESLDDEKKKRDYASTCLWFVLGAYTAMLLLVSTFSRPLAEFLLDSPDKANLIELAGWSYWVAGALNIFHGQLRWELRAGMSALLSLLSALLILVCTVAFVVWLQWGVRGALLAQIFGGLLALLPSVYLTRSSFGLLFDGASLRSMLVFSTPLIPSSLAVISALYLDRIILKEWMTLADVGIYAVGQKVSFLVALALVGFRSALTPLIYANHAKTSIPSDLAKIFRVFCAVALVITLWLSVFAREIVELISAEQFHGAARVVPLLIFSVLLANMYIFAPGLELSRKTGIISAINIAIAVLSLMLNYLLIPFFGILGAAISSLLAFASGFLIYMYSSQRLYPIPHDWRGVVKLLMLALFGIGVARVAALIWDDSLWSRFMLVLLISSMLVRGSGVTLTGMKAGLAGLIRKSV